MKKNFLITTFIFVFGFVLLPSFSFSQGMMENTAVVSDGHTAREEAEGKIILEKLQAKQAACADLSDDDFEKLGEYFMGTMMGASHEAMNIMMVGMMGKDGEEQMHIAIGKRMSNCEPDASIPQNIMNMMMGGGMMGGSGNSMMNFGTFGLFGWIFVVLLWVLVIVSIVALIKWLMAQPRGSHDHARDHENPPLEILKERYARSEIDRKEFEEKKKALD